MSYKHIDTTYLQASRKMGAPCGDAVFCRRSMYHTTIILADGIGSGIKAHIASQMNVARLSALLEGGTSLRGAFLSIVRTMSQWRDHSMPFCAFAVGRILNDGLMTILSYEMPPPVFIGSAGVHALKAEALLVEAGLAHEYRGRLNPGESVLMVSDGITQAGLGRGLANGWGIEGIEAFVGSTLTYPCDVQKLSRDLMRRAHALDGDINGDDRTVMLAQCRRGEVVNVLTGPPRERDQDEDLVNLFLERDGVKVICGATTADVVARQLGGEVNVQQDVHALSTPPRYFVDGIDLVTEGAVTLNQVYNILDEDLGNDYDKSAAADLACILRAADWLHFTVGGAVNPANADLVFRKQGVLSRAKIIPLIAGKLEKMGKLVDIQYI
ncbi:MAG: SpoIIE family protein phosphatase [Candidatus Omnitrophota bacterium]